jgi:hypothetical protein
VWATYHPTAETDLEKIEDDIIFKHDPSNPALSADIVATLKN